MEEDNVSDSPEPTTEASKAIKAIDKDSVHKICSGQVVVNLAIAVKELVENSVDAGATLVEVKLKEHGLESIEVSDNGSGVEDGNLQAMTAKCYTSKLREFSDLRGIATFGFRGEALSSLCALGSMVIVTRHASADVGTKIELNNKGEIVKKSLAPRQVGTTVTLSNIFSSLPVRRKEFTKNVRKEFQKMCQILQAYCLATQGVRIICTNISSSGSKTTFISTHGSNTVLENIRSVFGSKQVSDLVEIKQALTEDEIFSEDVVDEMNKSSSSFTIDQEDIERLNSNPFKFEGWISSCKHGSGRSSKDRQYYFVNSRPCDPKNISKIVNDIYHQYNVHQYPFVFLNVIVERSEVDVNITPDKRQVLVNNEKLLLLAIKKSLLKTFGHIPSTFKVQNSFLDSSLSQERNTNEMDSDDDVKLKSDPKKFMAVLSQWKATGSTDGPTKPLNNKRKIVDEISARNFKMMKIQEYLTQDTNSESNKGETFASYKSDTESDDEKETSLSTSAVNPAELYVNSKEFDVLTGSSVQERPLINIKSTKKQNEQQQRSEELVGVISCKNISNNEKKSVERVTQPENLNKYESQSNCEESEPEIVLDTSDDEKTVISSNSTSAEINTSIEEIKMLCLQEAESRKKAKTALNINRLRFKSAINPSQNKSAEDELQREINKDMFARMDIIGQFNFGFIIVKLDQDLFIVDQHASDEKYNFENLQKTTVLQSQQMVLPQRLDLTAVNEMILIDNIKVFEANGFKFQIDDNAPPTRKVKLLAKPFSKNWEFGKEDIDELIFMLQEAPPDSICRPSRIRSMFASRACRKSVMIGTALNKSKMKRLILNMGQIDHPWNCPHGRPTMRHLVNLAMLE